jgi:hypothetical protein
MTGPAGSLQRKKPDMIYTDKAKAKSVSDLSFDSLLNYYQGRFSGICVDGDLDPEGYHTETSKLACDLASDLVKKLTAMNAEGILRDKIKQEKERISQEKYAKTYDTSEKCEAYECDSSEKKSEMDEDLEFKKECKSYKMKDAPHVEMDGEGDLPIKETSPKETEKMRRHAKKLRKEAKRTEKLVKRQERIREKIRRTGHGLEPRHAVISCPDCAAQLMIGVEYIQHRN